MNIQPPPHWHADGLCNQTDPEAFYPEKDGDNGRAARRVCAACPVRDTCLEDALEREEPHGIWGGMSAQQRRAILDAQQRTTQHHTSTSAA
jgi:WhiB family redox-sensing transcriptional regulator